MSAYRLDCSAIHSDRVASTSDVGGFLFHHVNCCLFSLAGPDHGLASLVIRHGVCMLGYVVDLNVQMGKSISCDLFQIFIIQTGII